MAADTTQATITIPRPRTEFLKSTLNAKRALTAVKALFVILLCRVVSSIYCVLPPADLHRVSGVTSIVLLLSPVESSVSSPKL